MQLLDFSPGGMTVFCLVLLVGGFVRGYSGFGFSAILMAGLGMVLTPAEIVPLAIALEVLASIGQARQVWPDIQWLRLSVILVTGMIGNPAGVWLLLALPADALLAFVYLFIAAVAAVLLLSPRLSFPISWPVLAGAGLVAGVVNGATALSGLVLALLFTLAGVAPIATRATLVAYFFATDLWTAVILIGAGLFDETSFWRIGAALPLMTLGLWLGGKRFIATPPQAFRAATLCLLLALSLVGLGRNFLV